MIGESLSPTPRQRAEEILRRLAAVGRSPLLECTKAQAEVPAVAFGGIAVYVGMRHWHP